MRALSRDGLGVDRTALVLNTDDAPVLLELPKALLHFRHRATRLDPGVQHGFRDEVVVGAGRHVDLAVARDANLTVRPLGRSSLKTTSRETVMSAAPLRGDHRLETRIAATGVIRRVC